MSISRFGSERIVRAAFEYAREHGRSKVTAAHQANIFFFQAEDGIRDIGVTGVQTCALPIYYLKILPSLQPHRAISDSLAKAESQYRMIDEKLDRKSVV